METKLYKYPKTLHFPWSENLKNDDRMVKDDSHFKEKFVIASIKMDGENTTLYRDNYHARSLDGRHHSSRNWIKNFHGKIKHQIPEDYRICGENMYAKHSIYYKNLESYFLVFSAWCKEICLDWSETRLLVDGLSFVPIIYMGIYNRKKIEEYYQEYCAMSKDEVEGYVVRTYGRFHLRDFNENVSKFVRKNHVRSSEHWMHSKIEKNKLKHG